MFFQYGEQTAEVNPSIRYNVNRQNPTQFFDILEKESILICIPHLVRWKKTFVSRWKEIFSGLTSLSRRNIEINKKVNYSHHCWTWSRMKREKVPVLLKLFISRLRFFSFDVDKACHLFSLCILELVISFFVVGGRGGGWTWGWKGCADYGGDNLYGSVEAVANTNMYGCTIGCSEIQLFQK